MSQVNDLIMPKLGLTMTEGTLASWEVKAGSRVSAGDLVFVVETDKIATDINAPGDGEVLEILVEQGETVPVGTPVARWTGEGSLVDITEAADVETSPAASAPEPTPKPQPQHAPVTSVPLAPSGQTRIVASPYARRLARQQGLDLGTVKGSGPGGRIKAADVRAVMLSSDALSEPDHQSVMEAPRKASSIQQAMARRMVAAKRDVPHFYLSTEVEVSRLVSLRRELNSIGSHRGLTLNDCILASVVRALEAIPSANRIWLENDLHDLSSIDVGLAVSTDQGLFAPVVKALDGLGLDAIARAGRTIVSRARAQKLVASDLVGGAITISNAGMYNVTHMTPIINPPQSAILGVGSIRDVFRPNDAGNPVLRREMGLTLACDHRVHDGVSGLALLNRIVSNLQAPLSLLRPLTQEA